MSTIQRITGTNSGLDVDALVKASMTTYQNKIDKETQNQKILEYQQEQYKQIMSDASDFYDKYFDVLKTGNIMSTTTYQTVTFESGDDTKVTAKGFAGADVSNYTVKVDTVASKATALLSTDDINGKVTSTTGETSGLIYINMGAIAGGTEVNVDIATTPKKEADGTYKNVDGTQIYKQSNGKFLTKDTDGNLTDVDGNKVVAQSDGSFKYEDGTVVTDDKYASPVYEADMATTVANLNKKLAQNNIGVTAKYSEFSKGIILESTQMGENVEFSALLTDDADPSAIDQATLDANKHAGTDLKGTITKNGLDYDLTGSSNTVTVDNVQFSFKAPTTGGTAGTGVTLTGSTDVTALKDKIVSFINDYNTLLSSINTKLYEERDTDYLPLTDAQREAMTDDQITAWEKKAQTGLLRKDSNLERITSAMKSAMSSVMSGSGLYLEKIGISPVDDYAEKNGMYTIDEEKLTQALEENAGNIKDLFTRSASTADNEKGGILTQLKSVLNDEFKKSTSVLSKKVGIDGTSTQYNNTLTTSIYKKKLLIADLNDSFSDKENALYKKYSALESALESLYSQQSSLASMLGTS